MVEKNCVSKLKIKLTYFKIKDLKLEKRSYLGALSLGRYFDFGAIALLH